MMWVSIVPVVEAEAILLEAVLSVVAVEVSAATEPVAEVDESVLCVEARSVLFVAAEDELVRSDASEPLPLNEPEAVVEELGEVLLLC